MRKQKIRLGVNIDHCATLRQIRGGVTSYPDILQCAKWSKQGGAEQITIHLREDRRHIQDKDLKILCQWRGLPINLEMALNSDVLKMALKHRPDWVCFVPEKRQELTTEGGLDALQNEKSLALYISQLKKKNIKVSLFIAPDLKQVNSAKKVGADAVEFHTGHWVLFKKNKKAQEWVKLVQSSNLAHELGLKVHAGHGLDYQRTKEICKLNFLEEVNIGHSLICYSLQDGLVKSVRKMKKVLNQK